MVKMRERIKTVIHADMLDTIGRQFKFKHAKGTAEWLKNSLDNYLRLYEAGAESRSGQWPVLIGLINGSKGMPGPNLAVVDFGGASYHDVQTFLLNWGDRSAASHGRTSAAAVTGGHGNGGKFYMREMFKDGARFLTWRDGKMTSLVVDKKESDPGTTGEWEAKDESTTWRAAVRAALPTSEGLRGGDELITYIEASQPQIVSELDAGRRGLTILVGRRAIQTNPSNDVVTNKSWNAQRFVDELRDAAQARRPIRELAITVLVDGEERIERLTPETLQQDPEWPEETVTLPDTLVPGTSPASGAMSLGVLRLRKAITPLTGPRKDQNTVFVTDSSNNLIASYPISELPLSSRTPVLTFLQGELQLTFTTVDDYVQNDRERLVKAVVTDNILNWVAERIVERVNEIEHAQRQQSHKRDLDIATILNNSLNEHAKNFLQEMQTEIFVDLVDDHEGGGPETRGNGKGGRGGKGNDGTRENGVGGRNSDGGTREEPGTTEISRKPQYPRVLLSNHDENPAKAGTGEKKDLTVWHPPLYQDDEDRRHNVWWINTAHTFAQEVMKSGGPEGKAFKSYHLFMFRDVVQREALRMRQKREAEIDLAMIENDLAWIIHEHSGLTRLAVSG